MRRGFRNSYALPTPGVYRGQEARGGNKMDPISAVGMGPGPWGALFCELRSASKSIKSGRPDSVLIEDCSRHVGSVKRSAFKFRRSKVRPCKICMF